MQLTDDDITVLRWLLLEDPHVYVANIESIFEDAEERIQRVIADGKAQMEAATDKRPRAEREADERFIQPSPEQLELQRAEAYAALKAKLAAARELGLTLAESKLQADLDKISADKQASAL